MDASMPKHYGPASKGDGYANLREKSTCYNAEAASMALRKEG